MKKGLIIFILSAYEA